MMDWLAAHGQVVVLLVFFFFFIGYGVWALWPSNKKKFERYANIPLKESHDGQ